MEVPRGRQWAHLLAALEALALHLEREPAGTGAADAFLALQQQGAPREMLWRPALLRPLAALTSVNDHPVTALLAANLLRGVAEAGPDCCEAVRDAGGVEALTRLAGRAAGGAEGLSRAEALAAEAAVAALRPLLGCGSPAAAAAAAEAAAGDPGALSTWASRELPSFGDGCADCPVASSAKERGWLHASLAYRAAGGVPVAVALLAFGPDRRIVRDALAILSALICGEGAATSAAVVDAQAAAATEFQAAGGLEALAAVVSLGSTAPRAQSAVGKALRLLRDLVASEGATLPAVQAAGCIGAVIGVLGVARSRKQQGGGSAEGARAAPDVARLAQQTLAVFGQHYTPFPATQLALFESSSSRKLHSSLDAAGSSFNWSADGLASLGVNSIHVDDAGCEEEGFSGADSDAGSECRSDASASDSCGFSDEQESHSPVSAAMRRKPLHIANSSAEGKGPLHWAAQFGEAEALQQLLQTAVDASPQDGAGNTPLHLAAFNSHRDCVRALLWGGADAMAYNRSELLPLDVADPAAPAWATLEQELRWRTCLQASHPCELIWDHAERPQPLLRADSRRSSGGLAASRSGGGSDGGSVAGSMPPSRSGSIGTGGSAPSDRSQSGGMQCHFEPLTGEVVISNRAPPPQPAAKALVRRQKKSRGAFRRRLLGCTSKSADGKLAGAAAADAASDVAMLLISHRLRAEPIDKMSVYVTMDTPDPVLGEYPDAVPAGAPVGIAVRLCGAAELCAALQLMQARLHPDLAQAHAAVAALRASRAEHSSTPAGRAGLARHAAEARHNVKALLQRAQRLEAACRQASEPLPVVLHRRRERASLHTRLLGEYLAALGQPPPRGAATDPQEVPALLDGGSPWRELGPPVANGVSAMPQPGSPAHAAGVSAMHDNEQLQPAQLFTAAGEERSEGGAAAGGPVAASVSRRWSQHSSGASPNRRAADGPYDCHVAALSDELRAIAKRLGWTPPRRAARPQLPSPSAGPRAAAAPAAERSPKQPGGSGGARTPPSSARSSGAAAAKQGALHTTEADAKAGGGGAGALGPRLAVQLKAAAGERGGTGCDGGRTVAAISTARQPAMGADLASKTPGKGGSPVSSASPSPAGTAMLGPSTPPAPVPHPAALRAADEDDLRSAMDVHAAGKQHARSAGFLQPRRPGQLRRSSSPVVSRPATAPERGHPTRLRCSSAADVAVLRRHMAFAAELAEKRLPLEERPRWRC